MTESKEPIIRLIEQNARRKVAELAGQYLQAPPEDRETIQSGIEIEKWLADSCRETLEEE